MILSDSRIVDGSRYVPVSSIEGNVSTKTTIGQTNVMVRHCGGAQCVRIELMSGNTISVSENSFLAALSDNLEPVFIKASNIRRGMEIALFCPMRIDPEFLFVQEAFDSFILSDSILESSETYRTNAVCGFLYRASEHSGHMTPMIHFKDAHEAEMFRILCESLLLGCARHGSECTMWHNSFVISLINVCGIIGRKLDYSRFGTIFRGTSSQIASIERMFKKNGSSIEGTFIDQDRRFVRLDMLDGKHALGETERKTLLELSSWMQSPVVSVTRTSGRMSEVTSVRECGIYSNGFIVKPGESNHEITT